MTAHSPSPAHAAIGGAQPVGATPETVREWLSALADGELQAQQCSQLMQHIDAQCRAHDCAALPEPLLAWQHYQLIGQCLRRPAEPAWAASDSALFLQRLRLRLAEQTPEALTHATAQQASQAPAPGQPSVQPLPPAVGAAPPEAANAAVLRWKVAAGLASVAAVAAMGWHGFSLLSGSGQGAQQLASAPAQRQEAAPAAALSTAAASASASTIGAAPPAGQGVLIRDPQLDELLNRHYANTQALQQPAPFLRNASLAGSSPP
ncbi:MAG: RseA family anti-sigma factor [Comamonadaceae bacterium]|nr:RseA family anti-sigma factor [Comamonadaceae bacterium]